MSWVSMFWPKTPWYLPGCRWTALWDCTGARCQFDCWPSPEPYWLLACMPHHLPSSQTWGRCHLRSEECPSTPTPWSLSGSESRLQSEAGTLLDSGFRGRQSPWRSRVRSEETTMMYSYHFTYLMVELSKVFMLFCLLITRITALFIPWTGRMITFCKLSLSSPEQEQQK